MPKLHKQPVDRNDLKVFKLVNGQHIGCDYTVEPQEITDKDGNVTGYIYPSKKFDALTNDCYVLSPIDLVKKCVNKFQAEPNWSEAHRHVMKGEKPSQHVQVAVQPPPSKPEKKTPTNLNSLTTEQLEQYARDEEIDLKGAKTKTDILRVIRSSV